MMWGTILALWGTGAIVASSSRSLGIRQVNMQLSICKASWPDVTAPVILLWHFQLASKLHLQTSCSPHFTCMTSLWQAICAVQQHCPGLCCRTLLRPACLLLQVDEAEDKLRESLDPYIDWVADRMEPVKKALTFETLRSSANGDTQISRLSEALRRKLSNLEKHSSSS